MEGGDSYIVRQVDAVDGKLKIKIIKQNKVPANDVSTKTIATNKVARNAFVSDSETLVDMAIQNNTSHHVGIQHFDKNAITRETQNIRNQTDSSQQTEVLTRNFGVQKNDDEMDALLKEKQQSISIFKAEVQEYEKIIKDRDHKILSHQKTIIEQRKKIAEREKVIEEREKITIEREKRIKVYEGVMRILDKKLARSERRSRFLIKKLNNKVIYCKRYHRVKPKPKKRNTEMFPPSKRTTTSTSTPMLKTLHRHNLQDIENLQQEQQQPSQQALDQCTNSQSSVNHQHVFNCLQCNNPATLLCDTCRNCCTCSISCYDLIAAKHKEDCLSPKMIKIKFY